jgi:hypothetical protein
MTKQKQTFTVQGEALNVEFSIENQIKIWSINDASPDFIQDWVRGEICSQIAVHGIKDILNNRFSKKRHTTIERYQEKFNIEYIVQDGDIIIESIGCEITDPEEFFKPSFLNYIKDEIEEERRGSAGEKAEALGDELSRGV